MIAQCPCSNPEEERKNTDNMGKIGRYIIMTKHNKALNEYESCDVHENVLPVSEQ